MEQEKKIYIVAVQGSTCYAYHQLRDDAKFIENVFQVAAQNLYRRGIEYRCNAALLELHVPVNMPEKVWLSDLNRMIRWGVVVVDKGYNGEDIYELLYHNIDENLSLCLSSDKIENFMIGSTNNDRRTSHNSKPHGHTRSKQQEMDRKEGE